MEICLDYSVRIYPKVEQKEILSDLMFNFKREVNNILEIYKENSKIVSIGFAQIPNTVPWDSKIEVIKHANRIFRVAQRSGNKNPELNEEYCCWTNLNFSIIDFRKLNIQVLKNGNESIEMHASAYVKKKISEGRLISLKIVRREEKWIAKITVAISPKRLELRESVMGIDMGVKVPAVAITDKGEIRFFGNGRYRRYLFITSKSKLKKYNEIEVKHPNIHKPTRWKNNLVYQDHKISKDIITFALDNDVYLIKMENLYHIQKKRSQVRSVSTWSYYRLMKFIEYKAYLNGIKVELVEPYMTSQKCPKCFKLNKQTSRIYYCSCGFKQHRDLVAATNIMLA